MSTTQPTRQVVLNLETTSLTSANGDRIIEIAAVELMARNISGSHLHTYLNPERDIDSAAQAIHGLSREMLQDKPKFSDIADEFIEFIRDARLVVHNAPFDLGFLRNELSSLGLPNIEELCPVIFDTLSVAREQRRGKKNSLDALCTAHQINVPDNDMRGALLDAYMLAEVYLAMTNGPPHEGRETEGK